MSQTLSGVSFVWRGNSQDYNYRETCHCLAELCDEVVFAAGGDDNTFEDLYAYIVENKWTHIKLIPITQEMWDSVQGREKLSVFQNVVIEQASGDWICLIQADEVLYPESFPHIRAAINIPGTEAYMMKRYHVWRDPLHRLELPQERKPASTEVIRLARNHARCFDDGESLGNIAVANMYITEEHIAIYHAGYVRDSKKMAIKARHMIVDIFGMEMDSRIGSDFDHSKFGFAEEEIVPVPLPVPKFIRNWLKERYPKFEL